MASEAAGSPSSSLVGLRGGFAACRGRVFRAGEHLHELAEIEIKHVLEILVLQLLAFLRRGLGSGGAFAGGMKFKNQLRRRKAQGPEMPLGSILNWAISRTVSCPRFGR